MSSAIPILLSNSTRKNSFASSPVETCRKEPRLCNNVLPSFMSLKEETKARGNEAQHLHPKMYWHFILLVYISNVYIGKTNLEITKREGLFFPSLLSSHLP